MKSERGAALILALMFLTFLSILGGALLTTSTIDIWIGDNYKTAAQSLYLAESGAEQARELLRNSPGALSTLLDAAAGLDDVISISRNPATLLASDDQPLIPSDSSLRTTGQTLTDLGGQVVGNYHVWLRNDAAEGVLSITDANKVVNLLVVATVGTAQKVIEVTVKRGEFPSMPAALMLNGDPVTISATSSSLYRIDGNDAGSANAGQNAIGVISDSALAAVNAAIPDDLENNYVGAGGSNPDIANVSAELDPRLRTVTGIEKIASSIAAAATDRYNPAHNGSISLANIGSSSNYRIVVVNGDFSFSGTGYGVLLVRGDLTFSGAFTWSGLVLVIGQGKMYWNSGASGSINGGIFIANTRNADRSANNPGGTLRTLLGGVTADLNGGGGSGIQYNTAVTALANQTFPYSIIASREY
jgi:hypothetical protein